MRRFLLIVFFSFPFWLCAQENLLMNGDFEDENICTEYAKNCAPEGWISTSLFADYYFDDAPNAYKGQHFVGMVIADSGRSFTRNFIRSRLLCGLRKGAQYQLEFYIRSVHDDVLDSIGIYFSANDFLYQKEKLLNVKPQLFVKNAGNITSTKEWQKVTLIYTASGDENFISIGDFKTSRKKRLTGRSDWGKNFYFFIDDVRLTPLNPQEHLCAGADSVREEEYSFDVRHNLLDKLIYRYTKSPPPVTPSSKTVVQRIDTLIIPDVLFTTNSYAINAKAKELLNAFALKTKNYQIDSVVVEGHTDDQGAVALNQKLSESRAASVAQYLQPHFNRALLTRGWASDKPVADNRTAEGKQKNRRVEIYVYVRE